MSEFITAVHFDQVLQYASQEDFLAQMEASRALKNQMINYLSRSCPTIHFGAAIEDWIITLCRTNDFDEIQKHSSFIISCQSIIPRAIIALLRQMVISPVPQLEWCFQHFPNREICARRNALEILLQGPHRDMEFTSLVFYNKEGAALHDQLQCYVQILLRYGARAGHDRNLIHLMLSNPIPIATPRMLTWLFAVHPSFDPSYYAHVRSLIHETMESIPALMNTLDIIDMLIDHDDCQGYKERHVQYIFAGNRCSIVSYLAAQFALMTSTTDHKTNACLFQRMEEILLKLFTKDATTINLTDGTTSDATVLMSLLTIPRDYANFIPFIQQVLELTMDHIDFNARQPLTRQNIFHIIVMYHMRNDLLLSLVERNRIPSGNGLDIVVRRYRNGITPSFLVEFLDMCGTARMPDIIPCLVLDVAVPTRETVFNRIVSGEIIDENEFDQLCFHIFENADAGITHEFFDDSRSHFAGYMLRHFCEAMHSTKYLEVMLQHLHIYCPQLTSSIGKLKTEDGVPLCMLIFGQLDLQIDFIRGQVLEIMSQYSELPLKQHSSKYLKQNMLHVLFMGTDMESLEAEHVEFLRTLLFDYQVDPNQPDKYGNTPFHYLAQCGRPQTIYRCTNWCRRRAATVGPHDMRLDVDMCADSLHWMQYKTLKKSDNEIYHELIQLMLQAGANPTLRNKQGRSPLILLAAMGRYEAFMHVLLWGSTADPTSFQPDKDGNTILHWLCARMTRTSTMDPYIVQIVSYLLEHHETFGLDPFAVNRDGFTCYTSMFVSVLFIQELHPSVLDLLELFGPRITRGGDIFFWLTHAMVTNIKHQPYSPESMAVAKDIFSHLFANMESPHDFHHAIGPGKNTPLHLVTQAMPSQLDPLIEWFIVDGHANIDAVNSRKQTPRNLSASARSQGHTLALALLATGGGR